jgi:hypothetical protein
MPLNFSAKYMTSSKPAPHKCSFWLDKTRTYKFKIFIHTAEISNLKALFSN